MSSKKYDVLVVDDEKDIRILLGEILSDEGYAVQLASSAAEAMEILSSQELPKLVILDIWLEENDIDGIYILKHIKTINPNIQVIMISGHGNIETAVKSTRLGAYDFIEKPFKAQRLLITVQRALEAANMSRVNMVIQHKELSDVRIVGTSREIASIRTSAVAASNTNSRVMILGEHGTGKDTLARHIHYHSKRASKPFIPINISNLPSEQLELELFGGYDENKIYKQGAIEQAEGGTLFIEEALSMPLQIQTKMLNFLQTTHYSGIGIRGNKSDIRIISSSTINPDKVIDAGQFQKSLYYRLNVIPITMPPLRNRKEDIKPLTEYFISKMSGNRNTITISEDAYAVMQLYDWPGNIRQLKNILEWLFMMHNGNDVTIVPSMLPNDLVTHIEKEIDDLNPNSDLFIMKKLKQARDEFEKRYLATQLRRFDGNISKTANFIGMDRTALHRKLKSLNITSNNCEDNEDFVA